MDKDKHCVWRRPGYHLQTARIQSLKYKTKPKCSETSLLIVNSVDVTSSSLATYWVTRWVTESLDETINHPTSSKQSIRTETGEFQWRQCTIWNQQNSSQHCGQKSLLSSSLGSFLFQYIFFSNITKGTRMAELVFPFNWPNLQNVWVPALYNFTIIWCKIWFFSSSVGLKKYFTASNN